MQTTKLSVLIYHRLDFFLYIIIALEDAFIISFITSFGIGFALNFNFGFSISFDNICSNFFFQPVFKNCS